MTSQLSRLFAKQSHRFLACALAVFTALPAPSLGAALTVEEQELNACLNEADRVDRLICFDALFKTPARILADAPEEEAGKSASQQAHGRLESIARKIEAARPEGDEAWQFRYGPLEGGGLYAPGQAEEDNPVEPGGTNVYLTMAEVPPADADEKSAPAILLLSCEADITTASLIPGGAASAGRAPVRIQLGGAAGQSDVWQTFEEGRVISAARGLGSIAHISRWFGARRVQLGLTVEGKPQAFVFEMKNLGQATKPLRRACHW